MKSLVLLATGIGLGGSAAASYRAHRNPMSPAWDEPVGDSRYRRSDLPVGGAVALTLALGSLVTGHLKVAAVLAGAGLGATAGSLGVALMDPLVRTEPSVDESAPDSASQVPWPEQKSRTDGPSSGDHSAGESAGSAVLTPGIVTSLDLAGATSATMAVADDALGGMSTDTADGLAAEERAKSMTESQQESDQSLDTGATDEQPSASGPDSTQPSWTPDTGDDDEVAQHLEEAAEAVEHQASYGSPALDDMSLESDDESAWESEVTGSAPQEGQPSSPETRSDDKDG